MTSPKFVVDFASFWSNLAVDITLLTDVARPHGDWNQADKDALTAELGTLGFAEQSTLLRHLKGVAEAIATAGVNCDLEVELTARTRNYKPEWLEKCEAYAVKYFGWTKPAKVIPPAPTIVSIIPEKGLEAGGNCVTITGAGFLDKAKIFFDGNAVGRVDFVSATELKAWTLAHAPGDVDVVVTNPDSQSATSPIKFTYIVAAASPPPPPAVLTLTSVDPPEGDEAGGYEVVVNGTGFLPGIRVFFNTKEGTDVTVLSPTELKVKVPPRKFGKVNVRARNLTGAKWVELPNGFEYVKAVVVPPIPPVASLAGVDPIAYNDSMAKYNESMARYNRSLSEDAQRIIAASVAAQTVVSTALATANAANQAQQAKGWWSWLTPFSVFIWGAIGIFLVMLGFMAKVVFF